MTALLWESRSESFDFQILKMNFIKTSSIIISFFFIIVGCSDEQDASFIDPDKILNYQPLGSAASDLLNDDFYEKLTIEIVSVDGFEPSEKAIAGFSDFVSEHLNKPKGIEIIQRNVPASGIQHFDIKQSTRLENLYRTRYTKDDEITVYIYFADGYQASDHQSAFTLGTSYHNTSIIIYEKTLKELSQKVNAPQLSTLENAALNHEFGHLLGLVNTEDASITNGDLTSKNLDHTGHCDSKGCLMQAAIPFGTKIMEVMGQGVPLLDEKCLKELTRKRGF